MVKLHGDEKENGIDGKQYESVLHLEAKDGQGNRKTEQGIEPQLDTFGRGF